MTCRTQSCGSGQCAAARVCDSSACMLYLSFPDLEFRHQLAPLGNTPKTNPKNLEDCTPLQKDRGKQGTIWKLRRLARFLRNKRACTSFWTCSTSPGHWSHTREPSSSHAAASAFKVCVRKRSLLTLRIPCLDRSRWRCCGTLVGIHPILEKGVANQEW